MSYDKNNAYYISGLVAPSEWDWRHDMKSLARQWWDKPFAFATVDVGKLLGLVERLDELDKD